jgi:hypothetical protein
MSYHIYKICCDDCPEFVYVGHTKAFRQRKRQHKIDCYNENSKKYNEKIYTTIRENGGWDNWRMVIVEECGEITFTEARIKEEEYRVKLNANMNSHRCYIADTNYHQNYSKKWYEENKERVLEKQQEKTTCECGMVLKTGNMSRHLIRSIHKKLMKENNIINNI